MVMLVFTLPSYDRVFKVIRDNFCFPKTTTPREVMERYRLVYKRDRVGRLVEAQRFLKLKFRMDRFDPDLLDELQREATRTVKQEGEFLVFEHLYTERKVTPLNVYLREENESNSRTRPCWTTAPPSRNWRRPTFSRRLLVEEFRRDPARARRVLRLR